MHTYNMIVANPHGLHMRPAAEIVDLVKQYGTKVRLFGNGNQQADGGSIMALLTLGLERGNPVRVEVEGANESQVVARLSEIFSAGGGI
ncbi:MAG: HPr family phosphocarrier protein [Kiritimatiellales bacterium]